eukprot:jgi/Mesvir1/14087/Mv05737-RA.1
MSMNGNTIFSVSPVGSVVDNVQRFDGILNFDGPSGGKFQLSGTANASATFDASADLVPFRGPAGAPGRVACKDTCAAPQVPREFPPCGCFTPPFLATVKLEIPVSAFAGNEMLFKTAVSQTLDVDPQQVVLLSVTSGSTIIVFTVVDVSATRVNEAVRRLADAETYQQSLQERLAPALGSVSSVSSAAPQCEQSWPVWEMARCVCAVLSFSLRATSGARVCDRTTRRLE